MNVCLMFKSAALVICAGALLVGCTTDEEGADRPPVHLDTQTQALGEASQAVTFSGIGAGEMPTADDRVAIHFLNRVRTAPYMWNIMVDTDGDMMADSPAPLQPAMQYQHYFAEAGRWQSDHAIEQQCFCAGTMEDPDQANATCCAIGEVNGEVACTGPRVECDDTEGRTISRERWEILNRGPGEIRQEFFWQNTLDEPGVVPGEIAAAFVFQNALGSVIADRQNAIGIAQLTTPIIPDECREPEESCEVGTCTGDDGENICDTETNSDCLGICQGDGTDPASPVPCTLPEPPDAEQCAPENLQQFFSVSYAFGRSSEPTPVLLDGVAYQLGLTADMNNPGGTFGVTPDGETDFAVHYFEPAGPPQDIQAVVDGNCVALDYWVEPPNTGGYDTDTGDDMGMGDMGDMGMADMGTPEPEEPYVGATYQGRASLTAGCHRYFFATTDAEGFITRFPTLGSLGVQTNAEGNVVPNDDTCPSWSPANVASSCLPAGDACSNGDTRPCYTGRDGTQDFGICGVGVETCEMGRWSGLCEGETRPDAEEECGDEIDNNCNGSVDEGCPVIVDPNNNNNNGNNANNGNNENNSNNGSNNANNGNNNGNNGNGSDKGSEDDGCSTVPTGNAPTPFALVALLLAGLVGLRRRR